MNDINQAMDKIRQFAAENTYELALEILEWEKTGFLRDGKVRDIATMLTEYSMSMNDVAALRTAQFIASSAIVNRYVEIVNDV